MSAQAISIINSIFSLGTLIFIASCLLLGIGIVTKDKSALFGFVAKNSLVLVFLVSLSGMLGSLVYEHMVGFAPCMLCWYQRIVMYPITLISGMAYLRNKSTNEVLDYSLFLASIGAIIGAWHNIEKIIGKEVVACDASGPSCLQTFVDGFGFIDIPVMSFTFFVLIILIIVTRNRFAVSN